MTNEISLFTPDPLYGYRWGAQHQGDNQLQCYALTPCHSVPDNAASVSMSDESDGSLSCQFSADGMVALDFGVVSAGWLEVSCDDTDAEIWGAVSEYNRFAVVNEYSEVPVKRGRLTRSGSVWRLCLNRELYEGVRFAWIGIRNVRRPTILRSRPLKSPLERRGDWDWDVERYLG